MEIMEILRPETHEHTVRLFNDQGCAFECTVTLHYHANPTPNAATRCRIKEALCHLNAMVNIQQRRLHRSLEAFEGEWPTLRGHALTEVERRAQAPDDIRFTDLSTSLAPAVILIAAE